VLLKQPIVGELWADHLERAVLLIGEKENFLFCGDIDPDSVGSMVSLALFLRLMDKQAAVILPNGLNENLSYLTSILNHNSIRILNTEHEIRDLRNSIEVVIVCDTANAKLIPFFTTLQEEFVQKNVPVVEVDHHFGADSEAVTEGSIKLFREANATTEIIGELLQNLAKKFPETTDPFSQRNILIGLITGLLGDTAGGNAAPFKKDFDYWMKKLEGRLAENTRWRKTENGRSGDSKNSKFETPKQIREYLDCLTVQQEEYLAVLMNRIDRQGGLGFLNLMNSVYKEIEDICKPNDSGWFTDILGFLLNHVPEETGKVGVVCYNGKNAEGEDCIFIKLRRSTGYDGFDLRRVEGPIKRAFDGYYMGGGGHSGAASFRVTSHDEKEFFLRFQPVADFIKSSIK
jgi:nanoRNase/pAp phosphatase (c-di-AMP/oligoRNAs hydrolase)